MPFRKNYKKSSGAVKKKTATVSPAMRKAISSISKAQALKVAETKNAVQSTFNATIPHNGGVLSHGLPQLIMGNLLKTQQGQTDNRASLSNRIGDAIFPIGSKLMFQIRLPADRPNTTVKVWVVKYNPVVSHVNGAPSALGMNGITNNLMLDSVDNEQATVLKSFTFKSPVSLWGGSMATSKESTIHRTMWIPHLKTQYQYNGDNSYNGKNYNIGIFAGAYDTSSTLRTDNIAYLDVSALLYFKDP